MRYQNRTEAGKTLAAALERFSGRDDVIVLALPRGGVPVGYEVARILGLPLDVLVARKLGVPWQEELAMGAIAAGGVRVLNRDVVEAYRISDTDIEMAARTQQLELERRDRAYREDRPPLDVRGWTVLLVDDGIATGATALAAIRALRHMGAARIVLATPVAPPTTLGELRREADEAVCPLRPPSFYAIGEFYEDFSQVDDDTVRTLLRRSRVPEVAHV